MLRKILAVAAACFCVSSAHADIVIDPATGANYVYMQWSSSVGTGFFVPFTNVGFYSNGNTASITVAEASTIDFSITDDGIAGDAFAVELDNVLLTPTSGNLGSDTRGPGATSYFSALYDNIFLSAGNHAFTFFVTDSCCLAGGTSKASFSAATAVPASIPEPASVALLGLGMLGFAASRRKAIKRNG